MKSSSREIQHERNLHGVNQAKPGRGSHRIVQQYQRVASGVVYGILGDFHKSEDIVQETFLIAWKKLDELRVSEKLPAGFAGLLGIRLGELKDVRDQLLSQEPPD